MKPPFGYYGAKYKIASQIISTLPPHYAWVEAFCGSAALTIAKSPAPIEIINDIDDQIINLFEQLRNNSDKLINAVKLTPYARAEYFNSYNSDESATPLEKARKFLVAAMMTVNGAVGETSAGFSYSQSYSRDNKEARVSRWHNLPERLNLVVERIRNVRVENRDARELLEMFLNRPATLFYMDPPYPIKRIHRYNHDPIEESFHIDLLNLCLKSKCMLLVSSYDNELYNEYLTVKNGWTKVIINTQTGDTTGKKYSRREVLWKNSQFVKAYESGRIPIRLTQREKKNKKLNPSR